MFRKKSARIVNISKNPENKYSYDELSNMSLDELNELSEQSSGRNIIFSSTQTYLHNQNMTAATLIGIFANHNTAHAFTSMQDIEMLVENPFKFNGVLVDNNSNNKLDKILALDNITLISKNIAGYLAASVDAVKDPVLNFLNLNTFTSNVAMVLARLGHDSDSIGLFLSQPIIEKITKEYFKSSNEKYVTTDEIINKELKYLKDKHNITVKSSDLIRNEFSKEELAKNIALRAKGIINNATISYQAQALLLFQQLATMGQDLGTLTFLTKFNSVSNAVGPTIADTIVIEQKFEDFMDKMTAKGVPHPFSENAIDIINNSPILKAFYNNTIGPNGASHLVFGELFPHYTDTFQTIRRRLKTFIPGNIDSKLINKLVSEFMLYKMTISNQGEFGDSPIFDGSPENRTKFINNFVKEFKERTSDITENELINAITVKPRDHKNPISTLQAKVWRVQCKCSRKD